MKYAQLIGDRSDHFHDDPPADGRPKRHLQATQEVIAAPTVQGEGYQQDGIVCEGGIATDPPKGARNEASEPLGLGIGKGVWIGVKHRRPPISAVSVKQSITIPPKSPKI